MTSYKKLIREALGLDTLFNLNKDEKVALKFLHKKYEKIEYTFQIRIEEMLNYLEEMGFNFTTSMKLASLYKNNRDKLFKQYHEKYYDIYESQIIYAALSKFMSSDRDASESEKILKEKFKNSILPKKFGENVFYVALWAHPDEISFYITHGNTGSDRWKCIMTYSYKNLENKVGDIKSIPFDVKIRDIEGSSFPIPELEGSTDRIEIPITFNIEDLSKNDIYEIVFGDKNSLYTDFIERMLQIMSIDN